MKGLLIFFFLIYVSLYCFCQSSDSSSSSSYSCSLADNCDDCLAYFGCRWCVNASDGYSSCLPEIASTDSCTFWNDTDVCPPPTPYEFCSSFDDCNTCKASWQCAWDVVGCAPLRFVNLTNDRTNNCSIEILQGGLVLGERRLLKMETNTELVNKFVSVEINGTVNEIDSQFTYFIFSTEEGFAFSTSHFRANRTIEELTAWADNAFEYDESTYNFSLNIYSLIEFDDNNNNGYCEPNHDNILNETVLYFENATITLNLDNSYNLVSTSKNGFVFVNYTIVQSESDVSVYSVNPFQSKFDLSLLLTGYTFENSNSLLALDAVVSTSLGYIAPASLLIAPNSYGISFDEGAEEIFFTPYVNRSNDQFGLDLAVCLSPFDDLHSGLVLKNSFENVGDVLFSINSTLVHTLGSNSLLWDPLAGIVASLAEDHLAASSSTASSSGTSLSMESVEDETFLDKLIQALPFIIFIICAVIICAIASGGVLVMIHVVKKWQMRRHDAKTQFNQIEMEDVEEGPTVDLMDIDDDDDDDADADDD